MGLRRIVLGRGGVDLDHVAAVSLVRRELPRRSAYDIVVVLESVVHSEIRIKTLNEKKSKIVVQEIKQSSNQIEQSVDRASEREVLKCSRDVR